MMENLNNVKTVQQPDAGAISVRAYHLWEQAGRPQGRDREFWMEAEIQLRAELQPKSQTPALTALADIPVEPALLKRAMAPRVETPMVNLASSNRNKKNKGSSKR
jgi:hypothetical protein